jgi:glutaredoxin
MMFVIYSKPNCSFCVKAKALLDSKNIQYQEHILDIGQTKIPAESYFTVEQLKALVPNVRTVPQIFFGDILVGGFTELQKKLG